MRFFIIFFAVFLFAKNVLILNSYSIKFPWTRSELDGILSILSKKDLKIYIEFMDTKVFRPTPKRLKSFYEYLQNKYNNFKFDIVITTDDNALSFVREHKNTSLFKNAKIFFAGVNNLKLAKELNTTVYAGVFEKKEPLSNLKFIEKITNVKNIYVVADNSNSAKSVIKEYKNAFKDIKNKNFIYINTQNLEEVIDKVKNAKDAAMMLLTPFSFYLKSNHINYKYAIALISKYFNYPIVIHTDLLASLKKSNIVGGKVTDGISQGKEVAKKVIKYLNYTPLEKIGFTFEKANLIYLNVKNLSKFGINAYSLDYENPVYVNKPYSFYEIYKEWIIGGVVLFFAVFTIASILFIKNIQFKKYNFKIKDLNLKLEDEIQKAIDEITQKEKRFNFYKEEAFKKIIKSMIFQLKYPIEKLYKDKNYDEETVEYLKSKIEEFENIFLNNSLKEKVSVKNVLEEILVSLKPYFKTYGVEVEIRGDDFYLEVNKNQFKQVLFNFFKEIKDNLKLKDKIVILLENKKIVIKTDTLVKENMLSKVVLENYLNTSVCVKTHRDSSIVEIKLL